MSSPPHAPKRRVLVVCPHFPPTNAPDSQRIRTALPYLANLGWEAHILAVQPDQVEHPQDANLLQTLPSDTAITRVGAIPLRYTRPVGLGNLGLRCWPMMQRVGDRLLASQRFDLVFFSTTIFPVMALGPHWQRRFGVPYVLDFQDPWRSDYHQSGKTCPPGGRLKYGITQTIARWLEPAAVRQARHILSVSPTYPEILRRRYPHLQADQFTVLPFGAPEQDFDQLPHLSLRQPIFDPQDGDRHWVYVGRAGSDMALALRALFLTIGQERQRNPHCWERVRLHFVGTSYAPGHLAEKSVETIAQSCGVADLVSEHPQRIPYFEALQLLRDSDAILLIGSDDASYTASKLYPCILARKPILAVFHRQSSVVEILRQCQAGQVVTFESNQNPVHLVPSLATSLNDLLSPPEPVTTDWAAFQPYTARAMAQRMVQVFDRCLCRLVSSAAQPNSCSQG